MQIDLPPVPPVPPAPHYFGICEALDTPGKVFAIRFLCMISAVIYLPVMMLGFYNMWHILVKRKYYRSLYLSLLYLFGQFICLCKIANCIEFFVISIHVK